MGAVAVIRNVSLSMFSGMIENHQIMIYIIHVTDCVDECNDSSNPPGTVDGMSSDWVVLCFHCSGRQK